MNGWNAVDLDSPRGRLLKEKLELEQREQTPEIKCRLHEIRRELSKLERESASWWREDEKGAEVSGERDYKAAALEKLEMQEWAVSSLCKKIGGGNSGYTRAKAAVRELAKQGKIVIYKYGNAERACLADRYTPPPARKSREELEAEIEQLREALRQVQDWAGLHDNHKRVCAERDQLRDELKAALATYEISAMERAALFSQLEAAKAELEKSASARADLAAVVHARNVQQSRLDQLELQSVKAERDQLKAEIAETCKDLDRNAAIIAELEAERDQLKAELDERVHRIEVLERQLQQNYRDYCRGIENHTDKNKELREELAKAQRELDKSGVMAASFLAALLDSIKVSACLASTTEQASKD